MSESWILEAIEREAMKRAEEKLRRMPMVCRFMAFDEEQVAAIVGYAYSKKHVRPDMTASQIRDLLWK